MSDERWERQKALFDAASRLPTDEREAFVEAECDDPSLRRTVLDLLAEHDDGDDDPIAATVVDNAVEIGAAPETIGRYRVVRKLGEGGMGVVYEARQLDPERLVALKVVRGGSFVDEATVRMFRREAQSLGRLKHPNIAAIHEAGRTEQGQHFFAMELVRGEPLSEYATKHGLSSSARLELFVKICAAIHYAHQRGVIHRDLKPSNILVDSDGEPKILDFGLARITDTDVAMTTVTTMVGKIQGTLAYMSPEQARGNPDEIDARADVYALGVILFELMTGRLPYDLGKSSLPEALRIICDVPPLTASTIQRTLRGDIDTIARKALEKRPADRYQSADALAEDVRRHLADQPILARPPSTVYQLRKLIARHRVMVTAAAAIFVVAIAASVISTVLFLRAEGARSEATAERDRANLEAASARRVTDYLIEMFGLADPAAAPGEVVTAEDLLDRGVERIDELDAEPEIQARLLAAMGQAQDGLGLYERSVEVLYRALAARRELYGADAPETADVEVALGHPLRRIGRHDEACPLLEHAIAVRSSALGDEAGPTLLARRALGACYGDTGRYAEALALQQEVHAAQLRTIGADAPEAMETLGSMAALHGALGDYEEAADLNLRLLAWHREELGDDHPETLRDMAALANDYSRLDRIDEAIALYERTHAARVRVLGADHLDTVFTDANLTTTYIDQGMIDLAEPRIERLYTYFAERFGHDHGLTRVTDYHVGRVHLARGRFVEAEASLRRAVVGQDNDPLRLEEFRQVLARALIGQRRFEEAEAILLNGHAVVSEIDRGLDGERIGASIVEALVQLYEAWGRPEAAGRWRVDGSAD